MALRGNGQLLVKVKNQPLNALLPGGGAVGTADIPGFTLELLSPALRARPSFNAAAPADHWLLAKPTAAPGDRSPSDRSPWDTAHAAASATGYAHYIEPDILHEADPQLATPPDAGLNDDWPPSVSESVGIDPGWHLSAGFGAFLPVRSQATGAGVRIAHLDTGYTPGHASVPRHLNTAFAYDYWDNKSGAVDPQTQFLGILQPGHGTATLALLAGNTLDMQFGGFSFQGDFGGAPDAEVIPVRISPTVVHLYTSTMAKGLLHALAPNGNAAARCDVVTISHGGLPSQSWADAVNQLYEAGIVIVAASGDCFYAGVVDLATRYTVYPSAFNRVITALGATYEKKPYITDKFGVMQGCWGPDSVMEKAVAAFTPNVAWMNCDDLPNGFDMNGGGTSATTPQIAAACTLWLQLYRDRFPADWSRVEACRLAIFDGADGSVHDKSELGWGLLRAADALEPALANRIVAQAQAGSLLPSAADTVSFPFWRLLVGAGPPLSEEERMYETEVAQVVLASNSAELRAAPSRFPPGSTMSAADQAKYRALLAAEATSGALRQYIAQAATAAQPQSPPPPPPQPPLPQGPQHRAVAPAIINPPPVAPARVPALPRKSVLTNTGTIFVAAIVFIFLLNWWGLERWPSEQGRNWIWLATLASTGIAIALVGKALTGRFAGILIDNRNMMSLTRFQILVWSLVVLPALATAAASNILAGSAGPLDIDLPNQLLAALGIAGASFVATPVIHSGKSGVKPHPSELPSTTKQLNLATNQTESDGKMFTKSDPSLALWADLFRGDEVGNADTADLGKIQQFLVTLLLAGVYVGAMSKLFLAGGLIATFPPLSDQFVWLLAISHGTYLGSNAAPHTKNP